MNVWDWLAILLNLIISFYMIKSTVLMVRTAKDDADFKYGLRYILFVAVIFYIIVRFFMKFTCPECSFECPDWALQI